MTSLRNILDGYGSVLDLMPERPRRNSRFQNRMRLIVQRRPGDYAAVLQDIRRSMLFYTDRLNHDDAGTRLSKTVRSFGFSEYEKSIGLDRPADDASDTDREQLKFSFANDC